MKAKYFQFVCAAAFAAMVSFRPLPAEAAIYNSFSALEAGEQFGLDVMFSSVGLFVGTDATGANFVAGSGVLIDPWWVLTAAHVPFDEPDRYWESMRFNTSPDVLNNLDQFVGAAAWYTFPGYNSGGIQTPAGTGHDIGLVRLAEPIFTIQPATRFYGEDVEGTEMVMAGYGNPGVWPGEPGAFDGLRRAGQNFGDSFGGAFGAFTIEDQYWVSDLDIATPFPLEWNGSKNDSGGGWFADIGGEMYLVGITSGATESYRGTFATRISLYNDWIDQTMEAHSVPEPGSLALMSMGLFGLGARRLRRNGT